MLAVGLILVLFVRLRNVIVLCSLLMIRRCLVLLNIFLVSAKVFFFLYLTVVYDIDFFVFLFVVFGFLECACVEIKRPKSLCFSCTVWVLRVRLKLSVLTC